MVKITTIRIQLQRVIIYLGIPHHHQLLLRHIRKHLYHLHHCHFHKLTDLPPQRVMDNPKHLRKLQVIMETSIITTTIVLEVKTSSIGNDDLKR